MIPIFISGVIRTGAGCFGSIRVCGVPGRFFGGRCGREPGGRGNWGNWVAGTLKEELELGGCSEVVGAGRWRGVSGVLAEGSVRYWRSPELGSRQGVALTERSRSAEGSRRCRGDFGGRVWAGKGTGGAGAPGGTRVIGEVWAGAGAIREPGALAGSLIPKSGQELGTGTGRGAAQFWPPGLVFPSAHSLKDYRQPWEDCTQF